METSHTNSSVSERDAEGGLKNGTDRTRFRSNGCNDASQHGRHELKALVRFHPAQLATVPKVFSCTDSLFFRKTHLAS